MTDMKQDVAVERLRKTYGVKAGSTIYTTVLHVSRSGMSRTIAAYVSHKGEIHNVSYLVASAIGARFDRDRGGVVMGGCGMDMTFALVYNLSGAMWPNGHKCNGIDRGKHRCPSNDHANDYGQAARQADAELAEIGIEEPRRDEDAAYQAWFGIRRQNIERILDEELGYRKGRKHADGGYVLSRGSL